MLLLTMTQRERTTTSSTLRKEETSQGATRTHALPRQRAFVVQFSADATGEVVRFVGRVEHVMSGQTHQFSSPEELVAFFARLLRTLPEQ